MGPGYGGAPSGQDYGRPPPQGYEGGGFNGAGNYDSYQQQPQRQLFANARAPSSSFGASYDDHANSSKQRGLARNVSSVGATDDDLEAEYGRGRGGDAGGASSSAYDGLEQQDQAEQEEDDEVEAVKQQMRFTKQESLSSTRNALRIAREAEETATNTMLKLGDQSGEYPFIPTLACPLLATSVTRGRVVVCVVADRVANFTERRAASRALIAA